MRKERHCTPPHPHTTPTPPMLTKTWMQWASKWKWCARNFFAPYPTPPHPTQIVRALTLRAMVAIEHCPMHSPPLLPLTQRMSLPCSLKRRRFLMRTPPSNIPAKELGFIRSSSASRSLWLIINSTSGHCSGGRIGTSWANMCTTNIIQALKY